MTDRLNLLTFWAINDELDLDCLKEQLREMKRYGFDGTIFHPRYYPNQPAYLGGEYLEILSKTILYAKELGLSFWIYDENGWPSGTADGKVMERFPDSQCKWLQYEQGRVKIHSKASFNTFDKQEMAYFIQVVYDGYRLGLQADAFDYVTGFFSDEVGFLWGHGVSMSMGGIPWCEEAGERYQMLYQEDISKLWELLFTEGNGYETVRYRYWQILTDLLSESFYKPINQWCQRYGKLYTAHLKGEESLFFQVSCSGSSYETLRHVNVPAVDALERYPGNHYYPRVASSLAKQFYQGDCLCEAFGGSGWGLSPKHMEDYINWLAESGINYIAFHLWQYRKNSASVRDWPPNIPCGLTWKSAINTLFAKLHQRWDGHIIKQNRILLVAPTKGVMSYFDPVDAMALNEHNGAGTPDSTSGILSMKFENFVEHCYQMGMEFDVTEERIIEQFAIPGPKNVSIGNAQYEVVIFGEGCLFEQPKMMTDFIEAGIGYHAQDFQWEFQKAGENQILLDEVQLQIPYQCKKEINMKLCFLDRPQEVCVMGKVLSSKEEEGVYLYPISAELLSFAKQKRVLTIEIIPHAYQCTKASSPIGFLRGDFHVKNLAPYIEKDNHQMIVEDCFYLTDAEPLLDVECRDFLTAGYPFCGTYLSVTAMMAVGESRCIKFHGIQADCIFVNVDGKDCGYVWGPDWLVSNVSPGIHCVTIRLYPSTYNMYGPHHHIDGDRHLTTPFQYSGERSFADFSDAPEHTLIPQWHFVKFGIQ